jgi:hypothetical protein
MGMTPPENAMAAVWIAAHNQRMERFASLRGLAHRPRPVEPTSEDAVESRLAGLLLLFVPLAALAWVAIGWFIYRLAT